MSADIIWAAIMITFSNEILACDAATKGLERMASLEESVMVRNRDLFFYISLIIAIAKTARDDPKMGHLYNQIADLLKDRCTCLVNVCWLHNKGLNI